MEQQGVKKATTIPTIIVIFGITGDLSRRKLLFSLLDLFAKGALPDRFKIVGFARRSFTQDEIRAHLKEMLGARLGAYPASLVETFFSHIIYESGFFDVLSSYKALEKRLVALDDAWGQCSNKLFYLAVPPAQYEAIFTCLAKSKLTVPCGDLETGWTRILVEKPFGRDVKTAAKLDRLLGKLFDERQIFRIDHYLAKETLQNILAFRFANSIFEQVWSRKHIESVHIRLFEKIGIEGRGEFYDGVGALRDVGQNHMLQMLALIAMDEPDLLNPASIRKERARILRRVRALPLSDMSHSLHRAQYEGFQHEKGVVPGSTTETYFKLKTYIDTWNWRGVPFVLESGKAMPEATTEVVITFKETSAWKHADTTCKNILTFRIQPNEGIELQFWAKKPGFEMSLHKKHLAFSYRDGSEVSDIPDAYERILYDCIRGDQTLFASTEEVQASWRFITPIAEHIDRTVLQSYQKGSIPKFPHL